MNGFVNTHPRRSTALPDRTAGDGVHVVVPGPDGLIFDVEDWGTIPYEAAWRRQKLYARAIHEGAAARLVFCRHPCVITLGRSSSSSNVLAPPEELRRRGVAVVPVDRGGDVTLHAPGQWVVYVMYSLKQAGWGVHEHLRRLEEFGIALLRTFGLSGYRDARGTGVWVNGAKIMAVGIGVKKWVTYHGAAFNVTVDLSLYRLIRPCGLDAPVTSLERLGVAIPADEDMRGRMINIFSNTFSSVVRDISPTKGRL